MTDLRTPETFAQSVHPMRGLKARIRKTLRDSYLDIFDRISAPSHQGSFLRCIYGHYVFDDQRAAFEAHIKMFCNLGEFVTTQDMVSMATGETPIDGRYFHLSYDDGLECLYRNAVPVLEQNDIPAIVFVNSAVSGPETNSETYRAWQKATNYRQPLRIMDWNMLKQSGLEVGAHTRNHQRLSDISSDPSLLRDEIAGCKQDIEAALHKKCRYFAWPYGTLNDVDEVSVNMIRDVGYEAAFGVYRLAIKPDVINHFMLPRHHFEPQWPPRQVSYFARGGMEKQMDLPNWGLPK